MRFVNGLQPITPDTVACVKRCLPLLWLFLALTNLRAAIKDVPFLQDVSVKFPTATALTNAAMLRLEVDRDGVVYVLTDRGVARTFDDTLAADQSFRPLAKLVARDITLGKGALYYLFEDRWLSNGDSGEPLGHVPKGMFTFIAVADDGTVVLGAPRKLACIVDGKLTDIPLPAAAKPVSRLRAHGNEFFALTDNAIYRINDRALTKFHEGDGLTTLAV